MKECAVALQPYIETARKRRQLERERLQQKRQAALQAAPAAAQVLHETFGVSRVVVFGSVLDEQTFHAQSDIDLAVWELPPEHYLQAVAKLLSASEFSFDLVPAESASAYLQAAIAQGMPL
ncbi:MAG: nucleotidyltransferase domain-containing protein [Leptolyngbya sp. SIOISBB]|nr:nucleotidyltransferase domain-containing protein [Leptolyngbya sp. SIOISBB]